jgi:hypothetical protein
MITKMAEPEVIYSVALGRGPKIAWPTLTVVAP